MNINHFSHYIKSKMLKDMGITPTLTIGDYVYNEKNKNLYIILQINTEYIKVIDFKKGNEENMSVDDCVKAYISSELIDMLPIDFALPERFEEGWALVSGEGEIMLTSAGYYETQVDALISYLLFYLKHKIIG